MIQVYRYKINIFLKTSFYITCIGIFAGYFNKNTLEKDSTLSERGTESRSKRSTAKQNQRLLDLNEKLTKKLERVVAELNKIKQEREGKKLVKARKKDFELLFLMKDQGSYVFTSEQKPNQILRRETLTLDVNKVIY